MGTTDARPVSPTSGTAGSNGRQRVRERYSAWLAREAEVEDIITRWDDAETERIEECFRALRGEGFDPEAKYRICQAKKRFRRSQEAESAILLRLLVPYAALLVLTTALVCWAMADRLDAQGWPTVLLAVVAALVGAAAGARLMVVLSDRLTTAIWLGIILACALVPIVWVVATPGGVGTGLGLALAASTTLALAVLTGLLAGEKLVPVLLGDLRFEQWDVLTVRLSKCCDSLWWWYWPSPVDRSDRGEFVRAVSAAAGAARKLGSSAVAGRLLATESKQWSRNTAELAAQAILEHQRLVLTPSEHARDRELVALVSQLDAASRRDLEVFARDRELTRRSWWLWRQLPRVAVLSAIAALAVLLNTLFPGLSEAEVAQLRAVLVGTAILSLLSPTEGLKSAIDSANSGR